MKQKSRWAKDSAYGGKSTSQLGKASGESGLSRVRKEAIARSAERKAQRKGKAAKYGDYKLAGKRVKKTLKEMS